MNVFLLSFLIFTASGWVTAQDEVNIKRLVDRKNIIAKDRVPKNRKAETEQPPKVIEVKDVNYVLRDINDSYIYIKIESLGDVRPSEASIKNVVLTLDNKPIFTDGNSVGNDGQAFKYPWGVFSNGTQFMKMYGYQRGSHADVYGDREGLWARFKTKDFLTKSVIQNMPSKVQLSLDFRFGQGNRDPRKRYEILLGIGQGGDNGYENFDVLAKKIAAASATVPGNKDWETYEIGFLLQYKPAEVDDLKPLNRSARLRTPDTESRKRAVQDIQEAYAEDYKEAEQGTRKKQRLAMKLNSAAEEESDEAVQYALLMEAIRLLADAQDAENLLETTDAMAARFKIDALKIKIYFLKKIADDIRKRSTDSGTVDAMQSVVDQAISEDRYGKAIELLDSLIDMGERTKDRRLVKDCQKIADTARQEEAQFRSVQEAREILNDKPLNQTANQTVGEWYCLKKNRWEEGVTYLALGNQAEMKELSRLDLKLEKSANELVRIGDLCWELAAQMPSDQAALKERGVFWYRQAQPALSGVTKKKISNRIAAWQTEFQPEFAKAPRDQTEDDNETGDGREKSPRAKRSKPLTKFKPKKWDAPKNIAGTSLWSPSGRVVLVPRRPPIQIPGKNNIYLHPYREPGRAVLVYDLNGRYRSFTGVVGVPEIPGVNRPESQIVFSVIRDGEQTEIAKTNQNGKKSFQPFALDVTGVKTLALTTQCDGRFFKCFAFWFNPVLSTAEVQPLKEPDKNR